MIGWNSKAALPGTWKTLSSHEDLDAAHKKSFDKPVVLFKHSVTCGISARAMSELSDSYDLPNEEVEFYYLDLLAHRSVSNAIAEHYGVIHQSPQVRSHSQWPGDKRYLSSWY